MEIQFECITIEKDEASSVILGHAGFIKTVEDLYEAMAGSVPGVNFGIAFAEASGPINDINNVRSVREVSAIYSATSNPCKPS